MKLVAALAPNFTAVAAVKPVPVMVTLVPPAVGPLVGAMPVTVGAPTIGELVGRRSGAGAAGRGHGHVDRAGSRRRGGGDGSGAIDREAGGRGGAELDRGGAGEVGAGDGSPPVPPAVGPLAGAIPVTVGAPTKVNWSAGEVALVPPGVVTVTSTVPAPSAGEVAVMEVALLTVKLVAAVAPNDTAVAAVKPGAGDGHAGPARRRPAGRSDAGDRRRSDEGELVTRGDGAGAAGRGDRDVDRARSLRRRGGRDGSGAIRP